MSQSNGLKLVLAVAAVVVLLIAAHPLAAQATGTVRGTVTDAATHRPLAGVQINVVNGRLHAVTNGAGQYTLEFIPAGSCTLRAVFLGYKQVNRAIEVAGGQTTIADFALVGTSIPLTSVDAAVELSNRDAARSDTEVELREQLE